MKRVVLALSGGMDSSTLLLHLLAKGYDVTALSFDYGQKHRVELVRANKNIEAFWVRDMYLTETYKKLKRVDSGSPHITISHKKDFKSGDANTMFKKPTYKQDLQTEMDYLQGEVKWISFNNKKEKNDNRPIR